MHRRRRSTAGVGALFGALALIAGLTSIAAGTSYINLTTAGAHDTDTSGGVWVQGVAGAGTGTFDPFLTVQATPSETGVNVCDDAGCPDEYFDTTAQSAGRTHELLASAIPVITDPVAGVTGDYREFSLDSNDSGVDPWVSVDAVEIYLSTNKNLADYPTGWGSPIYSLPVDEVVLLNSQDLSSGSGQSDLTLFVPNSVFPTDCYYGSLTCNQYLFFYTKMGYTGDVTISSGTHNFGTTAGFEEWRVSLTPVVNVTKSANVSFTRSWPWTIDKTATESSIDLFAGQSGTIHWQITATAGTPVDSNLLVSGSITITNPTGGSVIADSIPAEIGSVDDLLTQAGLDTTMSVSCPVAFPYTLAAQGTLTCTYSGTPPNTTNGTNTATATINIRDKHGNIIDTLEYSGTHAVDFGAATVSQVDECIVVTDDNATPGDTSDDTVLDSSLCANESPGTYNFSTTVGPYTGNACTSTSVINTAHFETIDDANDTTQNGSDDATVPISCYQLGVTKDATPALTTTYHWTIEKSVDPETLDLFDGQSGDVTWTVTWTKDAGTNSGWGVTGTITIQNPAPMAANGVSVSDMMTGAIAGTVDCDPNTIGNQTTVDIPASSSAECAYSASLPDGTTRTNTATATFATVDYTGTAPVNFSGVTPTLVDDTATVTDDRGPLDLDVSSSGSTHYDETFTCGADEGDHTNNAHVRGDDTNTGDDASATTTVNCYQLDVSKDAITTFTRNYDWDITKTRFIAPGENDGDNDPSTLTLSPNQTYTASYSVVVSVSGYSDSDWAVHGTITVDNPAPIDADGVSVSDLITESGYSDVAATVDCDPATLGNQTSVDIPANSSAECSYSAPLGDDSQRLNTATASLAGEDYTGDADVIFDDNNPSALVDECVNVTDDHGGTLGQVCVGDSPKTFEYTLDIGPFAVCGDYTFTNTATYLAVNDENDTGETDSASYTVNIDIPCPEGCTLTQGYWKTHNPSFWGGAPDDATWLLLGDVDGDGTIEGEDEDFFLSGQTFFEVMWTSPQGNAYYNLAHQYIAAWLNTLTGADDSAIATAFADATTLFETYTPDEIAALKGKTGKALRQQFIDDAGVLGSYNEGLIGPGHCDDDGVATAPAAVVVSMTPMMALMLLPLTVLPLIGVLGLRRRSRKEG